MKKGFTAFIQTKRGFTLVEMMVAIALLSIIGVLLLNIFTRSLRGGNKARIVLAIKQNGQALLENLDKNIRSADEVFCVDQSEKNLVIFKNGNYTRYRFIDPTSAENGQVWQDNPVKVIDSQTDEEETYSAFKSRVCDSVNPMTEQTKKTVLTDTDPASGVSVQGGTFTHDEQPGFKDVVGIEFTITQGVGVVSGATSAIDPVRFATSVQLR